MNRKDAIAQGATRYFGKVCSKHPELQGDRYVASFGCTACALIAVKKNQSKNKEVVLARAAKYRTNNIEKVRAANKKWAEENKDYLAAKKREYSEKNKEAVSKRYKAYYEANYPRMLAKRNKQHASKLQRTPNWLTEDDLGVIEQAYELATLRTKIFGFKWHVDHKIPLRGKYVSGLHVPANLQVIPAVENLRKGNRF